MYMVHKWSKEVTIENYSTNDLAKLASMDRDRLLGFLLSRILSKHGVDIPYNEIMLVSTGTRNGKLVFSITYSSGERDIIILDDSNGLLKARIHHFETFKDDALL